MSDATLYIGSVTRGSSYFPDTRGAGISTLHWDGTAGALQLLRVTAGYDNPSWLLVDAGNRRLYATSEVAAWNEGLVIGYAIEPDGSLTHRGVAAAGGNMTCHLALSPDGALLAAANYATLPSGTPPDAALAIIDAAAMSRLALVPTPRHTPSAHQRQERSHPHCARFLDDGLWYADLGEDRLVRLDPATWQPSATLALEPQAGPRHFELVGDAFCVVEELGAAVTLLARDGARQTLQLAGQPAGLQVSVDGRHIYVSLRGVDQIAVLSHDAGRLAEVGRFDCGGRTPRDIALSPAGDVLFVANQDSHGINAFAIDRNTGMFGAMLATLAVGSPTCIAAVPDQAALPS